MESISNSRKARINSVINHNGKSENANTTDLQTIRASFLCASTKTAWPRLHNVIKEHWLLTEQASSRKLRGEALNRHNNLNDDELRCKANNLCLNALKKGKLSNNITRPMIEKAIKECDIAILHRCEDTTGIRLERLLQEVGKIIDREKKAKEKAKKNNKKNGKK